MTPPPESFTVLSPCTSALAGLCRSLPVSDQMLSRCLNYKQVNLIYYKRATMTFASHGSMIRVTLTEVRQTQVISDIITGHLSAAVTVHTDKCSDESRKASKPYLLSWILNTTGCFKTRLGSISGVMRENHLVTCG
ncbi:uncharacterized protein V6R79_022617 [Siganus canaliculatus]